MEKFFNQIILNRNFGDLNPVDCGSEYCEKGHAFGPAVREYYLIHYVVSGSGTFTNERGEYSLSARQLFLIRPGEVTFYKASETDPWCYIWIGFTGQLASLYDSLPDIITADVRQYFEAMQQRTLYGNMVEEYLTGQLFLLTAELFCNHNEKTTYNVRYAKRAANYIDAHYMEQISVEQIAAAMNIDRRYLSRLFKIKYGITTQEYLVATRMKHAASFLSNGVSVGDAAAMSGYNDVFNFSKMYKKYFGHSPGKDKKKD